MKRNEPQAKEIYTLGEVEFDDIEIGEVFAFSGCWLICEKITGTKVRMLAGDDQANVEIDWNDEKQDRDNEFNEGDVLLYRGCVYDNGEDELVNTDKEYLGEEFGGNDPHSCHKLPLSFQRLWKEE